MTRRVLLAGFLLLVGGCGARSYQETLVCIQNGTGDGPAWDYQYAVGNGGARVHRAGTLTGGNTLCLPPNASVVFTSRPDNR